MNKPIQEMKMEIEPIKKTNGRKSGNS